MKDRIIDAGLSFFRATGLDRAASFLTRGQGAILMFHNVRPATPRAYAPNQPLEVTPEFLETTIELLRRLEYEIIPVGDLVTRLSRNDGGRFAAVTFDDGYRDNLEVAAPILKRHAIPYTIYVTTGFVNRNSRLWWLELEAAIASLDHVDMVIGGDRFSASARTPEEKCRAYVGAYAFLRNHDEPAMLDCISTLLDKSGARSDFVQLCMTWDEVRTAAQDPLCTIGAHTLTHARLTKYDDTSVRRELLESREMIEREIGRPVVHLAYPFGDSLSAGPREFAIALECGYHTAVTTRPGVLFSDHREHMTALPRLAVHGGWQNSRSLESLLTGAPFALWNLGRRINVS
ncbi:MAG: polysaccharide deacetylase family protein [Beijerinckiaceae bacterium]|nr:polysaccharide deacetylase family protein [Beijerinckiaceae bacterium]